MKIELNNAQPTSSIEKLIEEFRGRLPDCPATYAWANEAGVEYIRLCQLRAHGNSEKPAPESLLSEFLSIAPEPPLSSRTGPIPTYRELFGKQKSYTWSTRIKELEELKLKDGGIPAGST